MRDEDVEEADQHSEVLEELREMPVGTNDPNIVGDVGPLDVPPGSDPHEDGELVVIDDDDE
jgi:hypothetical protein